MYTVGKERAWIDGVANDKLTMSHIDAFSGVILFQEPLNLPTYTHCGMGLNDFLYNTVNDHSYLTYESGFPEAVVLIEIDSQAGITRAKNFPFERETEFFQLDKRSITHLKPDGGLVFMHKSYKNATEQMNLFVTPLDAELASLGTFEFHIGELESTEHPTGVLSYDASKILITGVVPNKDPAISIEQVKYFMAMIKLDGILSAGNPVRASQEVAMYPNPANSKVNFILPDRDYELTIFDAVGKIIHKEKVAQKMFDIDVSSYQQGTYFVNFSGKQARFSKKLIVK